jgi:hypothetical protein
VADAAPPCGVYCNSAEDELSTPSTTRKQRKLMSVVDERLLPAAVEASQAPFPGTAGALRSVHPPMAVGPAAAAAAFDGCGPRRAAARTRDGGACERDASGSAPPPCALLCVLSRRVGMQAEAGSLRR